MDLIPVNTGNGIKKRTEIHIFLAFKLGYKKQWSHCQNRNCFESKKLARHSKTGMPKGLNLKMPKFFALAELLGSKILCSPKSFESSDQDI